MIRAKIEIEITNIQVDEFYYSFDYDVLKDGEYLLNGEYQSDHVWGDDRQGFKEVLEEGEALNLVMQQIIDG